MIFYKSLKQTNWIEQHVPVENGCPIGAIRFFNAKSGIAVSQNSVFYTDDAGSLWQESKVTVSSKNGSWHKEGVRPPDSLFVLQNSHTTAWLSYEGGDVLKTTDGGRTWRQIASHEDVGDVASGFGNPAVLYFATESVGWMLGNAGGVFETRDGGSSWTKLDISIHADGLSGADQTCWISGDGKLYRIDWN